MLDDASARFAIDRDRVIASGFSAGGMVVWNLACAHPENFAGFIPMSGTFWLKPPETCVKPAVSIVHIHGNADKTVPLTGRAIGETKQGDVAEALAMYKTFGGFGPIKIGKSGSLRCEEQYGAPDTILDFCLFKGGHSFRTEHLRHGIERLRSIGKI